MTVPKIAGNIGFPRFLPDELPQPGQIEGHTVAPAHLVRQKSTHYRGNWQVFFTATSSLDDDTIAVVLLTQSVQFLRFFVIAALPFLHLLLKGGEALHPLGIDILYLDPLNSQTQLFDVIVDRTNLFLFNILNAR